MSVVRVHGRPETPIVQGFRCFKRSNSDLFHRICKRKNELMSAFHREKVLSVRHWTDTLFVFEPLAIPAFVFKWPIRDDRLEVDGRPLLRAYSMASANHEEDWSSSRSRSPTGADLAVAEDSRRRHILVGRKATGTLISDNLFPGRRLLLAVDREGSRRSRA